MMRNILGKRDILAVLLILAEAITFSVGKILVSKASLMWTTFDYFSVAIIMCVCDPFLGSDGGSNPLKSCLPTPK